MASRGSRARAGALGVTTLLAGAVVGLLAVAAHGRWVGLALALVATVASVWALPGGWNTRLAFAVGWLVVVFYASRPRPEGDYLVAADPPGYTLLVLGLALVLLGIVTARRPPGDADVVGSAS